MSDHAPDGARAEPREDTRLRYSRRAVLLCLLGAGGLLGFKNPLELLGNKTTGAPGSPATEHDADAAKQDAERGNDGKNPGEDTEDGKPEETSGEEQRDREKEPPPPDDPTLYLYVPRLGIRGHTVREGDSMEVMARGAMKLPSTGHPWRKGANPYVAGHRIGYPGTQSHYQFYNLPAVRKGDAVSLTDANGSLYDYRVIEKFAVSPSESWVTEPVAGKDLVTLQTCTDSVARSTWWDITPKLMQAGPDTGRLIVRAERV